MKASRDPLHSHYADVTAQRQSIINKIAVVERAAHR
jgi:hypothetical protein